MIFQSAKMSALLLLLAVMPALPSNAGPSVQTPQFLYQSQPGAQSLSPTVKVCPGQRRTLNLGYPEYPALVLIYPQHSEWKWDPNCVIALH